MFDDMADVKVSILSWMIVGLMAASFIVLAKYLVARYNIAFFSEFVNAI